MAKSIFIELSNLQLQHLDQLTNLKMEVNELKNEVVAMDQGLLDKSGRSLSPGKSIHHDFNSATLEQS